MLANFAQSRTFTRKYCKVVEEKIASRVTNFYIFHENISFNEGGASKKWKNVPNFFPVAK